MIEALYRWRRSLADPLAFRLSRRELRALMEHADRLSKRDPEAQLEALVDATEAYQGRGHYARIHAIQNRWEILELTRRVRDLAPRRVVEIGTYKGGTLYLWCRVVKQLQLAVSIDLPGGDFGGGYDRRRQRLFEEFVDGRDAELVCLRADSHAASTLEALQQSLAGEPIDFLYLDGDHRYDGVRQDYEMYVPLVRPGGMVAFHDIVTTKPDHDVVRFWGEIRDRHRHEELVADPKGHKGIGILYV